MGDSGGPAFDSAGHIVGVTSFGDETCSTIGVSTRIDAYASWIDTTMASWGDPKNGTVVRADSGAAASDSGAAPPPSTHDTDASLAADASMGDDGSLEDAGTQAATVQASASGGCAVTGREGSRSSELAPLLVLGAAFVRRRRRAG